MKRRDFFTKAGIGSAALVSLPAFRSSSKDDKSSSGGQHNDHEQEHGHDGRHDDMDGPLSSANVSFGDGTSTRRSIDSRTTRIEPATTIS